VVFLEIINGNMVMASSIRSENIVKADDAKLVQALRWMGVVLRNETTTRMLLDFAAA
jgi:hypothetical protein